MLLDIVEEKRALAAAGDERAQRNLDYWTDRLDRAVDDPAARKLAGLPAREPQNCGIPAVSESAGVAGNR